MNNPPIICLMGPTASGKTNLALSLVEHLPCDIISVDSAMVYRGMDIGTAKPSSEELQAAPHRLIDIRDPAETYSAGQFITDAAREVEDILANGRIPLLVGGTMLYFRAFQQGLSPLPEANADVRNTIAQEAEKLGWAALHDRLMHIDPVAANRIDANDKRRIQRALEIHTLTGKSVTDVWQTVNVSFPPERFLNIALIPSDRDKLHQRIAMRFKQMIKEGLREEVLTLYERGDLSPDIPSLRSVGYRQVWAYLEGDLNVNEMEEKAIAATRQLAKRQLTWLRSWDKVHAFDIDQADLLSKALSLIKY